MTRSRQKHQAMPDPLVAARQEAEWIQANRHEAIHGGLDRILKDAPHADRRELLAGLVAYHQESMSRIPSSTKYPEAKPWVDYTLAVERELRRLAQLSDEEIALVKSLNPYLTFRGYKLAGLRHQAARDERCRGVFIPETDRGPMYIFNVDDPLPPNYRPVPALPNRRPRAEFWWDTVPWQCFDGGSGMHIDDEPAEIFPLPALTMAQQHTDDTPGAVEFLRRYSAFWSGGNDVFFDHGYRTAAIEKCSRNFFELFPPDPVGGWCHASGMVCRDPGSPQGRYLAAKRQEYCRLFGLADDNLDNTFWKMAGEFEGKLVTEMKKLGRRPRVEDVFRLFISPWPEGLWKMGTKIHPDQINVSYTIRSMATVFEEQTDYHWQRGLGDNAWSETPEVCRYQ